MAPYSDNSNGDTLSSASEPSPQLPSVIDYDDIEWPQGEVDSEALDEERAFIDECQSPSTRWEYEPAMLGPNVAMMEALGYGGQLVAYSSSEDMIMQPSQVTDGQQAAFATADDFSNGGFYVVPQTHGLQWAQNPATGEWCQLVNQKAMVANDDCQNFGIVSSADGGAMADQLVKRTPARVFVDLSCLKEKVLKSAAAELTGAVVAVSSPSPINESITGQQLPGGGTLACGRGTGGRGRNRKKCSTPSWR